MKIIKIALAVALLSTAADFVEAAPLAEASANTATTLQLPPPPPPPGLPRIHIRSRRPRYVRHRRYVRRSSGIRVHLPPPPPAPPRP